MTGYDAEQIAKRAYMGACIEAPVENSRCICCMLSTLLFIAIHQGCVMSKNCCYEHCTRTSACFVYDVNSRAGTDATAMIKLAVTHLAAFSQVKCSQTLTRCQSFDLHMHDATPFGVKPPSDNFNIKVQAQQSSQLGG